MKRSAIRHLVFIAVMLISTACTYPTATPRVVEPTPPVTPILPATPTVPTPGTTVTIEPIPSPTASETPVPTQPQTSVPQWLAYVNNGQLLVTDLTDGMQGRTIQFPDIGNQVTDMAWSPSGETLAFVSAMGDVSHLYVVAVPGPSSPVDLGIGSAPNWSPDSRSVAYISGTYPDDNIWITTIDQPAPRQLTFETNTTWGAPVFSPDGTALIVAGANRDNMGASGNTSFTLERLALDGSGARTPISGGSFDGMKLPYDLRFSPDGSKFAFSAYFHLSACASPSFYSVSNADGSNRQELISPSLKKAITDPSAQYHLGASYAWMPDSSALAVFGTIISGDFGSANPCQTLAGPQISIVGLDGSERTIIPGFFYGISVDRSGKLIASARQPGAFPPQPGEASVEIYSAQTGQLVLSLGPGEHPEFQP